MNETARDNNPLAEVLSVVPWWPFELIGAFFLLVGVSTIVYHLRNGRGGDFGVGLYLSIALSLILGDNLFGMIDNIHAGEATYFVRVFVAGMIVYATLEVFFISLMAAEVVPDRTVLLGDSFIGPMIALALLPLMIVLWLPASLGISAIHSGIGWLPLVGEWSAWIIVPGAGVLGILLIVAAISAFFTVSAIRESSPERACAVDWD